VLHVFKLHFISSLLNECDDDDDDDDETVTWDAEITSSESCNYFRLPAHKRKSVQLRGIISLTFHAMDLASDASVCCEQVSNNCFKFNTQFLAFSNFQDCFVLPRIIQ